MENKQDTVLQIEHLTVCYETEDATVQAVNDISFTLQAGKTLGLVGETGAGKTTTALSVLRLVPEPPGNVSGRVLLNGRDIYQVKKSDLDQIRGKEVSMIFQDPMTVLNPVFTVGKQIAECFEIHEHCSKHEAMEKAAQMLKLVGISPERLHEYPHQFSGGMKQRVVIAIALACNPSLLIADEPTTALDVTIQAQVLQLMRQLKEKSQMAMIMITHDLGIVAEICDQVAVMYAGRIVEMGTLEDVFRRTKHPYTEGLFHSIPNIFNRQEELKPIPGRMPNPTDLPPGCAFAPRCAYAVEQCRKQLPTLQPCSESHRVACIRYAEPGCRVERSRGV